MKLQTAQEVEGMGKAMEKSKEMNTNKNRILVGINQKSHYQSTH